MKILNVDLTPEHNIIVLKRSKKDKESCERAKLLIFEGLQR